MSRNIVNLNDERDNRTIYRVLKNKKNPYVQINKTCLNDERLSWKAKGLLAYMLSLPDDWLIHRNELVTHSRDGLDSVKSILKELKKFGYLNCYQERNEDGTFGRWVTHVFEEPQGISINQPLVENPPADNPLAENPPLLINNKTKETIYKRNNQQQTENSNLTKLCSKNDQSLIKLNDVVVVLMKRLQYLAISSVLVKSWLKKHGAAYVLEKVDLMESQKPQNPEGFLNKAITQDWKAALTKKPENKKGPIEPSYPSHDENLAWYGSLSDVDKLSYLQMALFKLPVFEGHLKYQKISVLDPDFKSHSLFKMFMGLIGRGK